MFVHRLEYQDVLGDVDTGDREALGAEEPTLRAAVAVQDVGPPGPARQIPNLRSEDLGGGRQLVGADPQAAGLKGAGTRIPSRCGLVFVYDRDQRTTATYLQPAKPASKEPLVTPPIGINAPFGIRRSKVHHPANRSAREAERGEAESVSN